MVANVLSRFFGSRNDRVVRRLRQQVGSVNDFEPKCAALSDDALRAQTVQFRERIAQGEPLSRLLPEA
ncbi:MAG: hypothetical protein ACYDEV_13540, partial [Acidiferrobacter sp.]